MPRVSARACIRGGTGELRLTCAFADSLLLGFEGFASGVGGAGAGAAEAALLHRLQ